MLKLPIDPENSRFVTDVNTIYTNVFAGMALSTSAIVTKLLLSLVQAIYGISSAEHGGGPSRVKDVGNCIVIRASAGII